MKNVLLGVVILGMSCAPAETTDACKGRTGGDLIITELMLDPEGTDTGGEWIEVFNTLGTPLDLKGLTLFTRDTDGSGSKTHVVRAGTAPARGYFVLGDVRSGPNPSWINYSYADGLGSMGNARGVVGLRCGQTPLAEFTWNTAARASRSRMLDGAGEPSSAIAAVEANYCDTPSGNVYFGNNSGTPGAANPRCVAEATTGTCVDNGVVRPMTAPQRGDLVITEVMASPAATSDTTGEWFELLARAAVDLNDLTIQTTTSSTRIDNMPCLRVDPGEYVLLARSADTFVNGGLPLPRHVYGSLSFADTTNQRIALTRGDAGIDEIALFPSASGKAWQLDPLKLDPGSNDDPNNFCRAPARWNPDGGGDYGSPGVENPGCPIADAGMSDPDACVDPISMVVRPVRRPQPGELRITEWMPDPAAVADTDGEFIEVLASADLDLNGVSLQVGSSKTTLASQGCLAVTANSFIVFGKNGSSAANGGLPMLQGIFSGSLANAGGSIVLSGFDGGSFDAISYSGSRSGASQQVDLVDAGVCDTPAGVRYAGGTGDRGTPGLTNVACP
ncbi:MAG: hypothetical protein Q8L48_35385 [Archangium sp.]|nr:hypothetical protein [Archangium sp.]